MNLYLIHIGMTLSFVFFCIGYYFRVKNTVFHIGFNMFGVGFLLMTSAFLLTMKYGLGGLELFGIIPAVDSWIVNTHRIIAGVTLLLTFIMVYTGITRKREIHIWLHRLWIPLFLIVYISGFFIFKNAGE